MKYSAIICEYNPLHNGHERLINYAKSISKYNVCIMSGNFTQRAMPAVSDKYTRAKHAILAGADIVIELPTINAVNSAKDFANGAISIINQLPIGYLVFGSESGNLTELTNCAKALLSNDNKQLINQHLSTGVSYPKALSMANNEYAHILNSPNNVLAIEYIQSLIRHNCKTEPITIAREDNYNSAELSGQYASATAIRQDTDNALAAGYISDTVSRDIDTSIENNYKQYVCQFISTLSAEQLSNIYGMTEGLHNRIFSCATNSNYDQLVASIKSKRYTQLKVQRLLLNSVLGITSDIANQHKEQSSQVRVLAIRENTCPEILSDFSSANLVLCDTNQMDIDKISNRLYSTLTGKPMPYSMQKVK